MGLNHRPLSAGAATAVRAHAARRVTLQGAMPWAPSAGAPPTLVQPGPFVFFSPEEGAAVSASDVRSP